MEAACEMQQPVWIFREPEAGILPRYNMRYSPTKL